MIKEEIIDTSKEEVIDTSKEKETDRTKKKRQFSKMKILLPYIVFVVSLLISTLFLYFNNYPKTNQPANNATVKTDTVFIDNKIANKKDIETDTVVAVNSLEELIFSTTTAANRYLQETTVYDTVKLENYSKQLKQLYSIKGLSDYENGILKVLIVEYERQIKNIKQNTKVNKQQ